MPTEKNNKDLQKQIEKLESQIADLKLNIEDKTERLNNETEKRQFYQLIADFTSGWELWFEANGNIKYCSPACFDLTGFTSNEIISSVNLSEMLVYDVDVEKFNSFIQNSLNQTNINSTLEFRLLTRTKQLRWCSINTRGVYSELGRYLGVRASIRDISKLKKALGSIHALETGKDFQNRSKQRLQYEIELKNRELVSILLQLSQKNEIISKIDNLIRKNQNKTKKNKIFQDIENLIQQKESEPFDWKIIEKQIDKLHPGFFDRLQSKHPLLTAKDKKLCAYLKLELTSKEISGLLNITPQSVEIARVRLRKKLKLQQKKRLSNYIQTI